jgi:hypothetical protein
MDPVTLRKYAYHEQKKQFYEWDRSQKSSRGTPISTQPGFGNSPSLNQQLIDRLTKGELVDRRRTDRTQEDLSPFDVGPYKSNLTLTSSTDPNVNRTYPKLSGIPAWTSKGREVNRDHVPSGESLNQRGDTGAYNQGLTIAIPNPEFHVPFSPTYGTDNSKTKGMLDRYKKKDIRRVKFDTQYPHTAFYRDTKFMLDKTENQDFSSGHKRLNLTQRHNRLRQLGGYRKLGRLNVKINKQLGGGRGFDPSSLAVDFKAKHRRKASNRRRVGHFKYFDVKGKTQGQLISQLYHDNLINLKGAKYI